MKGWRRSTVFLWLPIMLLLPLVISGATSRAQAFTLGEVYDSSNWQEVESLTPPFLLKWIKNGEFILKTGKIHFDFSLEKEFLEASLKNSQKLDISEAGFIINVGNGELPSFVYGLPFPGIDAGDSKAGEKIMQNVRYGFMRVGGSIQTTQTIWIGQDGPEREMQSVTKHLFYQGRPGRPIKNPQNFLQQVLSLATQPMDLRGTITLSLRYNDIRSDTCLTYVPESRRSRRTSPVNRSDSSLGSDLSADDSGLWAGKNETFEWRLIGERNVLCAFISPYPQPVSDLPNGSIVWKVPSLYLGFEITGWPCAPWAPINVTWAPRPVWVLEGIPKDMSYNYGKQIFYVDKQTFMIWFKQVFDRSGRYWKGLILCQSFQTSPSGKNNVSHPDAVLVVDDLARHATVVKSIPSVTGAENALYLPLDILGPEAFTMDAVQQLSK
jgi:hypothetical protein